MGCFGFRLHFVQIQGRRRVFRIGAASGEGTRGGGGGRGGCMRGVNPSLLGRFGGLPRKNDFRGVMRRDLKPSEDNFPAFSPAISGPITFLERKYLRKTIAFGYWCLTSHLYIHVSSGRLDPWFIWQVAGMRLCSFTKPYVSSTCLHSY